LASSSQADRDRLGRAGESVRRHLGVAIQDNFGVAIQDIHQEFAA
jgi:hypothetical protein